MRCLLLAVVAGLAVLAVSIRADEAVAADTVPEIVEEVDFDLDDDTVARMLGDLFDDEDFEEALEEQESNREARARGRDDEDAVAEEKAAPVDPKDQARYNSFIDTFFRRLNSYARSRFDPLSIGLVKKDGRKSGGKGGNKGGKDKKKDKKKGKGKKDGKDGKDGKKDKKEKGGKKKGRHPKDLDLEDLHEEEPEVQEEEVSAVEAEPEVHDVTKREAVFDVYEIEEEEDEEFDLEEDDDDEDDEESLSRVTRDAEEEDPAMEETSRRGKPAKGGKKGKPKKGKKNKGKGKGKGKGKKGKKGKKDKKGGKKKGGKKSKRSAKSSKETRTSRASVTGIATLRRDGDVLVRNKKGGKEMRAQFKLGPVDLKVSRKYGGGKESVTKDARAVSPELTGKLSIQVDQNGKARMTNFRINRPAIVQVQGSLKKNVEKGGKSDNNFMEKSISRFSPVASKKLKSASREILSAGEPKAQSSN